MNIWKPGMKAVCIDGTDWHKYNNLKWFQRLWRNLTGKLPGSHGPATDEICTVTGVYQFDRGTALFFREYPANEAYAADNFRPLLSDEQEELDRIEEEVNEPVHEENPQIVIAT